jgi:hypothetical protein
MSALDVYMEIARSAINRPGDSPLVALTPSGSRMQRLFQLQDPFMAVQIAATAEDCQANEDRAAAILADVRVHPFRLGRLADADAEWPPLTPGDFLRNYVCRSIACAIVEKWQWRFDVEALTTEFERARAGWEADAVNYTVAAPLSNARLEGYFKPVRIGARLEAVFLDAALQPLVHLEPRGVLTAPPPHVMLACEWLIGKDDSTTAFTVVPQYVGRAIAALRLFTEGRVGADHVVLTPTIEFFGLGPLARYEVVLPALARPLGVESESVIDQAAADASRSLLEAWDRFPKSNATIGISRFACCPSRPQLEDRLIDLTIALENALLPASGHEKKYQLSLRASELLWDVLDPIDTNLFLRKLYDARSAIVHGSQHLGRLSSSAMCGMSASAFVDKAEMITRQVLRRVVADAVGSNRGLDKFCEELDMRILKRMGGPPPL